MRGDRLQAPSHAQRVRVLGIGLLPLPAVGPAQDLGQATSIGQPLVPEEGLCFGRLDGVEDLALQGIAVADHDEEQGAQEPRLSQPDQGVMDFTDLFPLVLVGRCAAEPPDLLDQLVEIAPLLLFLHIQKTIYQVHVFRFTLSNSDQDLFRLS